MRLAFLLVVLLLLVLLVPVCPGQDREALLAALDRLAGDSWDEREEAVRLLSTDGGPVLPEIRALLEAEDPELRRLAGRILGELEWFVLVPEEVEAAHPGLRTTLWKGDAAARARGMRQLRSGPLAESPALLELHRRMARDESPEVAVHAVILLALQGGEGVLDELVVDEELARKLVEEVPAIADPRMAPLLSRVLCDPEGVWNVPVVERLLELDPSRVRREMKPWRSRFSDDSCGIVLDRVGSGRLRGAYPIVADIVAARVDRTWRDEIAMKAGRILLDDAESLGKEELDALRPGLLEGHAELRALVHGVFTRAQDPRAAEVFTEIFAASTDPQTCLEAYWWLLERHQPFSKDPIAIALPSMDPGKRALAEDLLERSNLGGIPPLEALVAAFRMGGPDAVRSAGRMGRRARARDVADLLAMPVASAEERGVRDDYVATLPAAVREEGGILALSDPDETVRARALEMLRTGTGQDLVDPRAWENWWIGHREPEVLSSLRALRAPDARRRLEAVRTLADHPLGIVREALDRLRDDPDPGVRAELERIATGH